MRFQNHTWEMNTTSIVIFSALILLSALLGFVFANKRANALSPARKAAAFFLLLLLSAIIFAPVLFVPSAGIQVLALTVLLLFLALLSAVFPWWTILP
jgi:hypothetical protein